MAGISTRVKKKRPLGITDAEYTVAELAAVRLELFWLKERVEELEHRFEFVAYPGWNGTSTNVVSKIHIRREPRS